eukprot:s717_g20.t1
MDEIVDLEIDLTSVDEGLMSKHMVVAEAPSSQIAAPVASQSAGSDGSKAKSLSRASSFVGIPSGPNFLAFKVSSAVENFMTNPEPRTATWLGFIFSVGTSIKKTEDFLLPNDTFSHADFMGLEKEDPARKVPEEEVPETQEDEPSQEVELQTPPPKHERFEDSQCLASIASNHSQYDKSPYMSPSVPAGSKDDEPEESQNRCFFFVLPPCVTTDGFVSFLLKEMQEPDLSQKETQEPDLSQKGEGDSCVESKDMPETKARIPTAAKAAPKRARKSRKGQSVPSGEAPAAIAVPDDGHEADAASQEAEGGED